MKKTKIEDICDILNGFAFKSDKYVKKGIRVIRIANVQKGYIEDNAPVFYPTDFSGMERYMLREGDLLMSLTGNVGRVALIQKEMLPAALNQRVVCLRINSDRITKKYLYHILNSDFFEQQCMQASNGVAQKNISTEWLRKYEIPLCSIDEQLKVTEILDGIQNVIDSKIAELKGLDDLVRSRFVELFGDPIENPKGYPIRQLSDYIISLTSGSRGWAQYCVDDGNEWFITIKNVKNCRITTDNMQPINAPDNVESKRTKVKEGDLLISITADLGRTGVVTKEIAEHGAYINQHLSCIRIDRNILNPFFVAHYMESPAGKEQFKAKNQSAVKAGLNFNSIKSLKLMIPLIEEQRLFADFVHQIDKSKLIVQKELDETQLLFDSLMQEYFG